MGFIDNHMNVIRRTNHMKLSTKSRYGLRALFDMAYHAGNLPAQIKDISRRQAISPRYLEQIFQDLKKAGLLKSRRGPQGGSYPRKLRFGKSSKRQKVAWPWSIAPRKTRTAKRSVNMTTSV
jgi:hypothetical protein